MTNHTSGPWRRVSGSIYSAKYRIAVMDAHGESAEEHDANADLIAAAPDLLGACQRAEVECRNQLMRLEVSGDVNGMATRTYRELAAALLAAIDKATGKGT